MLSGKYRRLIGRLGLGTLFAAFYLTMAAVFSIRYDASFAEGLLLSGQIAAISAVLCLVIIWLVSMAADDGD